MQEHSLFATPSPAFIFCRLFDDGHSDWCGVISHCSFDLHFSNKEQFWASFHVLASCTSSLEKCLFRYFCHFLIGLFVFLVLSCMKWSEVVQSCLTLYNPVNCSLPGSSIHGIFWGRILEWVAICFSKRSSWPRGRTRVSHIVSKCFTLWREEARKSLDWPRMHEWGERRWRER